MITLIQTIVALAMKICNHYQKIPILFFGKYSSGDFQYIKVKEESKWHGMLYLKWVACNINMKEKA